MRLALSMMFLLAGCDLEPPPKKSAAAPTATRPPPPTPGSGSAAPAQPQQPVQPVQPKTAPATPGSAGSAAGSAGSAADTGSGSDAGSGSGSVACLDVGSHFAEVYIAGSKDAAERAPLEVDRTRLVKSVSEACKNWSDAVKTCFAQADSREALTKCGALAKSQATPGSAAKHP